MKALTRIFIALAALAVVVSFFYLEENWRGKQDWENYKHQLEAKGYVLDWNKIIPPPVPDDENFFKAPKMQEWFVGRGETDLSDRLFSTNKNLTTSFGEESLINTAEAAKNYLNWSDQFEPDFNLIREALKRPYARMDGDYRYPNNLPVPNILTFRNVVQILGQRAHCYLLLNQPDKASQELTLMHNLCHPLEGAPTGKPMTLIAAMINIAVNGLYTEMVAEGFRKHLWQEPQMVLLQKQLQEINLFPMVSESFRETPANDCQLVEELKAGEKIDKSRPHSLSEKADSWRKEWNDPLFLLFNVDPDGWLDQNLAANIKIRENILNALDPSNAVIFPKKIDDGARRFNNSLKGDSPFKILAHIAMSSNSKGLQTAAHNQTMVNEAQIACALERYKLANGNYPGTLDALAPQFIEKIPHDIIGGQPLHYKHTNDEKFLLYSIGWNETDDGGFDLSPKTSGSFSTNGDWVWKN